MTSNTRRRGANAVEFALLLPVFVAVLGGSMEMGWLMFQHGAVRTAVTQGCRAAAMLDPGIDEGDLGGVISAAETHILTRYAANGGACDACSASASAMGTVPMRSLQCSLNAPYTSLTTWVGLMPSTLSSSVMARMEYQREVTP